MCKRRLTAKHKWGRGYTHHISAACVVYCVVYNGGQICEMGNLRSYIRTFCTHKSSGGRLFVE